jgi:ornithine cyclodeaminase
MRSVGRAEIVAALDENAALYAIRRAFVRFAQGRAQVAAVGHLAFADPPGDCHIKSAHIAGEPVYVVKVASSFYRNPERGLSSSQGLMLVLDAHDGRSLALLDDGGWLTDQRTAMAGVLAAQAIARPGSQILGIVGAGIQAELQAKMIARRLGFETILVWARNPDRAQALAAELGGEAADLQDLCRRSDLIVTTTPATEPLIEADWIGPGARIVAVGADSPGKRELAAEILGRSRVVVDSPRQCLDHGETAWAVAAGLVKPAALIELGALLAEPVAFGADEIVVADLTGVAIQDVAIAGSVWARLISG